MSENFKQKHPKYHVKNIELRDEHLNYAKYKILWSCNNNRCSDSG